MESTDEDNQADSTSSEESEEVFQDASEDETMAITVECPEQDCTGGTNDEAWKYTGDAAVAAVMLEHHLKSHDQQARQTDRKPRPPPLQPPKLSGQCSEAKFEEFKKLWGFYKNSVEMPEGTITSYLLNCLDNDLKTDVHAANADILNMSEEEVLPAIRQYAVQRRAISSLKMELWRMTQDEGENVRKFYARVKELAAQCQLTLPCPEAGCRRNAAPFISYSDVIVKQIILSGLADVDIKKEVLGVEGINNKSLEDTLGIFHRPQPVLPAPPDGDVYSLFGGVGSDPTAANTLLIRHYLLVSCVGMSTSVKQSEELD